MKMGNEKKDVKEAEDFDVTQDMSYLCESMVKEYILGLNETIPNSEKFDAYYIKRIDNHIEIGLAKINFKQ